MQEISCLAGKKKHGLQWIVIALFAALSLGCQSASSEPGDHDEEAHARPAHMPDSFVAAVSELSNRLTALQSSKVNDTELAKQIRELRDILGWLPELAGDTDLRKSDWEKVKKASDDLVELLSPWLENLGDPVSPAPVYDSLLKTLQQLAEAAQSPSDAIWK